MKETLDAALEPLLLQQKFKQGGTEMIKASPSQRTATVLLCFFLALHSSVEAMMENDVAFLGVFCEGTVNETRFSSAAAVVLNVGSRQLEGRNCLVLHVSGPCQPRLVLFRPCCVRFTIGFAPRNAIVLLRIVFKRKTCHKANPRED